MRAFKFATAALAAIFSFSAHSLPQLSYTYVEAGIAHTDGRIGASDGEDEGISFDVSFRLNRSFFITGRVDAHELDVQGGEVDLQRLSGGIGVRTSLSTEQQTPADMYAILSFENTDIHGPGSAEFDLEGLVVTLGTKFLITPQLEAFVEGQYRDQEGDVGGDYTGLSYAVGLLVHISRSFSATVNYRSIRMDGSPQDIKLNTWTVGGRISF